MVPRRAYTIKACGCESSAKRAAGRDPESETDNAEATNARSFACGIIVFMMLFVMTWFYWFLDGYFSSKIPCCARV